VHCEALGFPRFGVLCILTETARKVDHGRVAFCIVFALDRRDYLRPMPDAEVTQRRDRSFHRAQLAGSRQRLSALGRRHHEIQGERLQGAREDQGAATDRRKRPALPP
jgi:hypothetical protein